jgi:hypothetical protein
MKAPGMLAVAMLRLLCALIMHDSITALIATAGGLISSFAMYALCFLLLAHLDLSEAFSFQKHEVSELVALLFSSEILETFWFHDFPVMQLL